MLEALIVIYACLFVFTSCIMFLYYRRTREGSKEYTRAKTLLDDIILSFNRDLQRQQNRIEEVACTSGELPAENHDAIEEVKLEVVGVRTRLQNIVDARGRFLEEYRVLRKNVEDLISEQTEILKKMTGLEPFRREEKMAETRIESAIAITRDRALAPLTDTEGRILEMLASEGEKTAPQIRDKIKLTREHTARLMKRLYMQGYVERRTNRMPYVYRLNKEMEGLLRNRET